MLFLEVLALLVGGAAYGEVLNDFYIDPERDEIKNAWKKESNLNNDPMPNHDGMLHGNIAQVNIESLLMNMTFINALNNMPGSIRKLFIKELVTEIFSEKDGNILTESPHVNVNPTPVPEGQLSSSTEAASFNSHKCLQHFSCLNCTTARVCAPSPVTHELEEIARVECTDDKPYCDEATGSCVASIETALKCAAPSSDFICLKNGYFPHPTDCGKYYLCVGYKSYEFRCKLDYYYNAKSHACDLYYYSSNCYSFPCKGQSGVKVPYSYDSTIYAYCIGHKPFIISRCEGAYKLNTTSQKCEPVCVHEGLYEDVTDCTAYFKCVKTGLYYTRTKHRCPDNQGFEPSSFQCVSMSQVSSCSRPLDTQLDMKN